MAAPAEVALRRLTLTNFRNYQSASLSISARLVAFVGANGAGKTNLLEAISLLTAGRGLRRAALADLTRKLIDPPQPERNMSWALSAQVDSIVGETRIGTGHTPEGGRKIRIDGADARSSEALLEYLRVLWLIPAMDGLFTGAAGDRRRFLDRLVLAIDPGHGRRVADLEKALRQRNRCLADNMDARVLDAIEAQVASLGVCVALARRESVALLQTRIAAQSGLGLPFPQAGVALEGSFEREADNFPASDLEDRFAGLLARNRGRDRAAGRTLEGPHRSDLVVTHLAKKMPAAMASTGEQKALLIGLVLAHAELAASVSGMTPILLLDEVAAHLDPERRAALFSRLDDLGLQVFMTGTDKALFVDLPQSAEIFTVSDNDVSSSS